MKLRTYRLQDLADAGGSAGGSAIPTTDGATTNTPADTAPASAGATAQPSTATTTATPAVADGTPAVTTAPEAYTDFTLPEGVTLDAEVMGEFSGIAKDLGLSQESAQKVADIGAKLSQKWASEQVQAAQKASQEWTASTQSDPEIGGDKLDSSLAAGKKALAELGTPALSKLLNESGLGNHPEVVRFFARVGAKVSEDGEFVTGSSQGTGTLASQAQRMFPNMNP